MWFCRTREPLNCETDADCSRVCLDAIKRLTLFENKYCSEVARYTAPAAAQPSRHRLQTDACNECKWCYYLSVLCGLFALSDLLRWNCRHSLPHLTDPPDLHRINLFKKIDDHFLNKNFLVHLTKGGPCLHRKPVYRGLVDNFDIYVCILYQDYFLYEMYPPMTWGPPNGAWKGI